MIPARTPAKEYVRTFVCPRCGAVAGAPCPEGSGARDHNHRERVRAAQAWLGKQLQLVVDEDGAG